MSKYVQHADLVLTQVCGEYLLVATRSALNDCPYVNRLSPLEADYWGLLSEGKQLDEIAEILAQKLDIDPKKARLLLLFATKKMLDAGYLIEKEKDT